MKWLLGLIAALLAPSLSASAGAEKPVLKVQVERHHSRQWTQVFEGKDGWYCATEHNPMFPLAKKPASLKLFGSGKSGSRACRESFAATILSKGTARSWTGCADEDKAVAFLRALGKECGRTY